jgi:hypothetical protein
MAAPAGSVSMNSQKITALLAPTADGDAANKAYVDGIAQGLDIKGSVRAATTANITLSGTQTIDGVSLIADEKVLVKDQSTASENGIYDVKAGAWERSAFMEATESAAGAFTFVEEGTVSADSGWVCSSDVGSDVIGTNDLAFVQFSGAGSIVAGSGATKSGNTINVIGGSGLTANADDMAVNVDDATIEVSGDNLQVMDNGIGYAKLVDFSAIGGLIVGGTAGAPEELAVGTSAQMIMTDGSTVSWGQVQTASLADNAVTVAKMAGLARGSILYGDLSGDPQALTLGGANTVLSSDGTDASWNTIPNAALDNSSISGVSLGDNLYALSSPADSGLSMSSYNGSGAIADLKLDYVLVSGGISADVTGSAGPALQTGASILVGEDMKSSYDHPMMNPMLFRNGVLYQAGSGLTASSFTGGVAPANDGEWSLIDNGADVDLQIWETTDGEFVGDDWMVINVPVDIGE